MVLDSRSIADIASSKDVIVFSFVHLNLMQLYKQTINLTQTKMSRQDQFTQTKSFQLDDFIIKDQIGIGKFGAVYKAIEKKSQITVAIKIIPKRSIASQMLYTQLRREIEVQARLKHPSICELYAYFHDTNNVFMVLEYCPHGNLAFLIKQKKQVLSNSKIASIFLQLVYGLAYMHARHVMHRDLKLQNILLDQENNIKISDFGWCVHHPSRRDTFCGTMEYISPQMLNKESYQHSIDVYCLGIILYELFYFRSPFLGQNQTETIRNIKQGNLFFEDEVRSVCEQAKNLIRKLLDRDPLKRPKANQLLQDEFIVKYHKVSSQSHKQRRLTEQTFRQFKQEIYKRSQTQVEQKQLFANSHQTKIEINQSKKSNAVHENEQKENKVPETLFCDQSKESVQIAKQEQQNQYKKDESQSVSYIPQQKYPNLDYTEQSIPNLQQEQAEIEQSQRLIQAKIDIDQGTQANREDEQTRR